MSYKMVCTDLDGTFLNSKGKASEKNIEAIEKIASSGALLVPVTGRAYDAIPEQIRESEHVRYVISSNGSAIYDKKTGEYSGIYIAKEDVEKVRRLFLSSPSFPVVHRKNKVVIDAQKYAEREKYHFHKLYEQYFDAVATQVDDIDAWLRENSDGVEMMCSFFESQTARAEFAEQIKKIDSLYLTAAFVDNLEFFNKNSTKGNAVRMLCAKLGISPEQIIAIGDSDNDVTMLRAAGLRLAVSNASQSARENAEKIICSCDGDSLNYVYEHFIKKDGKDEKN